MFNDQTLGVTVLLPTRAGGEWLNLAVSSLLENEIHFEIVILFDGSKPDETVAWFKDPRVKCIALPKQVSLGAVLNIGIATAKYSYIARMDSDDISFPNRLDRQAKFLEDHARVIAVSGSALTINRDGKQIGRIGIRSKANYKYVKRQLLIRNPVIHPATMFRKDSVQAVGGYNESLRFMEDYDLWLRLALVGEIAVTRTEEIFYRLHPMQMSNHVPPRGLHISEVLNGRDMLARKLGFFLAEPLINAAWLLNQVRRYWSARIARRLAK